MDRSPLRGNNALDHPATGQPPANRPPMSDAQTASINPDNMNENAQAIGGIEKVELPPFWTQKPDLWFAAVEAQFQTRRVQADNSKYCAIVNKLDQETLTIVEDIIIKPPQTDKYETLKRMLLKHFSKSQEQRFRTLASGLQLGNQKPSMLLAEMNTLSRGALDADFVRTLWLDRLPQQMQVALTTAAGLDNADLSQLADKIHEIQQAAENRIMAVHYQPNVDSNLEKKVDDLAQQLQKLSKQIRARRPRNRSHSRSSRPRSTSAHRRESTNTDNKYCYFHQKFAERARKCAAPCHWTSDHQENSENRQ